MSCGTSPVIYGKTPDLGTEVVTGGLLVDTARLDVRWFLCTSP